MNLTALDRRSEDIRIFPVIISKLELGNIERHIFAAHFVECADHAAFENRPKPFDGLSMDCSDNILTARMVNSRVRIILVKRIVAGILIGTKQADPMRHRFTDEGGESGGIHICDHARNHIALAADGADDRSFAGTDAAGSAASTTLIPMSVFGQAADESFIDFDDTAKLADIFHQRGSDLMAHEPSGFVRTEAHIAMNLPRANALLAGQHEVNNAEPVTERFVRVLEDSSGNMRKAIALRRASVALPMPRFCGDGISLLGPATRAADTIRPTLADEVSTTSVFVWEHFFELCDGQLMDLGVLFCSGHDDLSFSRKTVAWNYDPVKSGIIAQINMITCFLARAFEFLARAFATLLIARRSTSGFGSSAVAKRYSSMTVSDSK
jgi:hypothetical protein